jgi:hypothetical protein
MGDVSDLIEATCNGIGAFDVTLSNLFIKFRFNSVLLPSSISSG